MKVEKCCTIRRQQNLHIENPLNPFAKKQGTSEEKKLWIETIHLQKTNEQVQMNNETSEHCIFYSRPADQPLQNLKKAHRGFAPTSREAENLLQ